MSTGEIKHVTGGLVEPVDRHDPRPPYARINIKRFFDPLEFVNRVAGRLVIRTSVPIVLYSKDKPWEKEHHLAIKSD